MENLRWVLIFAGVAILLALWLSGRAGRRDPNASRRPDPLLGDGPSDDFAERLDAVPFEDDYDAFGDIEPSPATAEGERTAARERTRAAPADADAFGLDAPPTPLGGLTQKIEAIGARLAPKRRQRVAASEPPADGSADGSEESERSFATKIVTLHVVAPEGSILPPEALHELFERRGYHHGDMSIYHSMYQGRTVFSIARMIKPGTFDPNDLTTFETPGIALILQLPGPVAADTAFEVMLSEAFEIAEELGGTVLDANRSTLGRQTEQHLREGIYEYMHRQKYFDSVA